MEHFKSRTNDYFHFTNPHDDITDLNNLSDESQYTDFDDDHSCDFTFHTYHPITINPSPSANSQTIDTGELMFLIDSGMKSLFDKVWNTIEGIGARVSRLEDGSWKVGECVEDVKRSEERFHGMNCRKLRQVQSVLQEVQDGVLFLRDKHEIAETQLKLAFLHGSIRDKVNIATQSPRDIPFLNQRSHEPTITHAVSNHPVVLQAHEVTAQQYVFSPNQQYHTPPQKKSDFQFPHFVQPQLANTSFFQLTNPRNYKSEFQAKYMPEIGNFSNVHLHGEPSSSHVFSNVKPVESFMHPQKESSSGNYNHTHVAQTLPHALPTAIDVIEESRFKENGNKIPESDIIDKVTGMGFRRDLVRGCVRKMTANGSHVDLNSVLDKMMKNK